MKLTTKQKKEIVKHNLQQAKEVVYYAKLINKGKYVHNINSYIGRIENLIKDKKLKIWKSEEFLEICEYKQRLSSLLFLAEKGI